MTDLAAILRLRELRESRATQRAAAAAARHRAASDAVAACDASLAHHERMTSDRESRLHDAMIAHVFTLDDLRHAEVRALSADAERDLLLHALAEAERARDIAREKAAATREALRKTSVAHEKIRLVLNEFPPSGEKEDAAADD